MNSLLTSLAKIFALVGGMEQWPSGGSGGSGETGQAQHVRTCQVRTAPQEGTARCTIAGSGKRRMKIPHHQLPRRANCKPVLTDRQRDIKGLPSTIQFVS
jgi:hypothetical protein